MKKLSLFAMLMVMSLALTGCLHDKSNDALMQNDSEVQEQSTSQDESMMKDEESLENSDGAMMEGDNLKVDLTADQTSEAKVSLNAKNFTFGTSEIKVKKGTTLTIAVTNEEGTHDFLIDELDIDSGMIKEGDTVELTIPTDEVGEYEYYCNVGSHRQMGMKGTLIIEE